MKKSSKPFPNSLNPIYIETNNWVLRDTTQTKKILSKKNQKNVKCVWHGSCCSKNNSRGYYPLRHGGEIQFKKKTNEQKPKNQKEEKKKKNKDLSSKKPKQNPQFICRNCYDIWVKWNRVGNPKIRTTVEWIKNLNDPVEIEEEEDDEEDDEYEEKDEGKSPLIGHIRSFSEEEYQIYKQATLEEQKEIEKKLFLKQKEMEKKERIKEKECQIEQLKKKFRYNEDQIIRENSLGAGKEPLRPINKSELLHPHSNYLVGSQQMHWLLNNVHCSCGQKKELIDLKEGYGSFRAILVCRNCKEKPNNEQNSNV
ncbi:hypothetical protein M0813_14372 [Anaeramoeba flamelloides]|uniref:Uncharacterized protein n=1 Tax=Anaeramoeba flamelloides TaxID=1746091 RepID=A0ABQ8Z658_9EUKA|nr:hypothetical protein M0813_14372 [Anaeramoeba flamelloides]